MKVTHSFDTLFVLRLWKIAVVQHVIRHNITYIQPNGKWLQRACCVFAVLVQFHWLKLLKTFCHIINLWLNFSAGFQHMFYTISQHFFFVHSEFRAISSLCGVVADFCYVTKPFTRSKTNFSIQCRARKGMVEWTSKNNQRKQKWYWIRQHLHANNRHNRIIAGYCYG